MVHFLATSRSLLRRNALPKFAFVRNASTRTIVPPMKPLQSQRVLMKESSEIPSDLGMIQGTFIMPTRDNLPSIFRSPLLRLSYEFQRIKHRSKDCLEQIAFRFMSKHKLTLFQPKKVAIDLHQDMYEAFARGDIATLRLICGEGLLESFAKQLMVRGSTKMEWRLHKYLSPVKLVSNRAQWYPGHNFGRKQAVIRIHSMQSLTKFTPQGKEIPGTGVPKEVVEYIVVEKQTKKAAEESSWVVWGTTEETKLPQDNRRTWV